jgi:hypothetical protein
MRKDRIAQIVLFAIIIIISAARVQAQGAQILYNKSFENTGLGDHPEFCLPLYSGETPKNQLCDRFIEDEIFNWFAMLTNWVAYYHHDTWECNVSISNPDEYLPEWFVHSPDWIGGTETCPDWSACTKGWDENYSVGMAPYEVFWQDFVGTDPSKYLDINKSYEVRIKVQPQNLVAFTGTSNVSEKTLDILLGTQAFTYQWDDLGLFDVFHSPNACRMCGSKYREYLMASTEDIRILKRFPIKDIENSGTYAVFPYPNPTYAGQYENWFEFHTKIDMADLKFTDPLFPITEFVQFGIDIRDPDPTVDSEDGSMCNGPYLRIDWVEFFESCPDHYDIYGTKIAGAQSSYVATDYITAGFIDKGPAIVTLSGNTEFIAGHHVDLVPGFYADAGAVLNVQAIPNVDCSLYKSDAIDAPTAELNRNGQNRTSPSTTLNNQNDRMFKIYPNPASNTCVISTTHAEVVSISILDNLGKIMSVVANIHRSEFQLDISNLPNGTYSLVITTDKNETYHEKLIKM